MESGSCLISFVTVCLFLGEFNLLIFKVITDKKGLTSAILLFVLKVCLIPISFLNWFITIFFCVSLIFDSVPL